MNLKDSDVDALKADKQMANSLFGYGDPTLTDEQLAALKTEVDAKNKADRRRRLIEKYAGQIFASANYAPGAEYAVLKAEQLADAVIAATEEQPSGGEG